jgi:hypothetical protein
MEALLERAGVGLEGSLEGCAIGSVKESRFAFLEAKDVARAERVAKTSWAGGGGGGMEFDDSASLSRSPSSLEILG